MIPFPLAIAAAFTTGSFITALDQWLTARDWKREALAERSGKLTAEADLARLEVGLDALRRDASDSCVWLEEARRDVADLEIELRDCRREAADAHDASKSAQDHIDGLERQLADAQSRAPHDPWPLSEAERKPRHFSDAFVAQREKVRRGEVVRDHGRIVRTTANEPATPHAESAAPSTATDLEEIEAGWRAASWGFSAPPPDDNSCMARGYWMHHAARTSGVIGKGGWGSYTASHPEDAARAVAQSLRMVGADRDVSAPASMFTTPTPDEAAE